VINTRHSSPELASTATCTIHRIGGVGREADATVAAQLVERLRARHLAHQLDHLLVADGLVAAPALAGRV
jgi:hypothetical protein